MPDTEPIDVQRVATLARIALTEEETQVFPEQIGKILDHVRQLESLDLEGIEPTAHAVTAGDVYRDDSESWDGLSKKEALLNAPQPVSGQFGVPKVVE